MSRVSLPDVNVLVALFFPHHVHHEVAHDWFADARRQGWATCPMTENGFLRVALQEAARGDDVALQRPAALVDYLSRFCASGRHHFWPDSVSLRDESLFDPEIVRGAKQLTDVYLLGLAHRMRGRLITFDQTIPLAAVIGARPESLTVLSTAD